MIFKLVIKKENGEIENKLNLTAQIDIYSKSLIGTRLINTIYPTDFYTLTTNNNIKILVTKGIKSSRRLYNLIKNNIMVTRNGKFLEIFLFGLSFNAIRKRRTGGVDLELHFSKKLRLYLPKFVFLRTFKRRLLFFSFSHHIIDRIKRFLIKHKKVNNYTGLGIRVRRKKVIIKKGKTR
jgi:hypothetical protein